MSTNSFTQSRSNGDDRVDIADPIVLLSDLFRPDSGSSLPPPGPFVCGVGVRSDPLGCESYQECP